MATITIKNGTPVGNESLCLKCASAHYQRGYRESEMVVYCARIWDVLRVVPFAVRECNDYRDADMPDRDAMEKIALIINPSTTLKPAGFQHGVEDKVVAVAAISETTIK
jgi:hypothetical protein